ncbi:MAG: 50S ribosomal protein L1 [Pseudomonadota bacterium]
MAAKNTKRNRAMRDKIEAGKLYPVDEAMGLLKDLSTVKFTESVEVAVRLGVDPRKSDQVVRGALVLPHGTGKSVRVAVFAQGENAEKAKAAGADIVGFEDLADTIKGGEIDFDLCIATPDAMRVVGRLGTVLGPRGLMPNPKVGTVTTDVEQAIKNAKAGQIQFRTDKGGIVHTIIGKADFDADHLKDTLTALLQELVKAKPAAAKGQYLRKVALSTTMGPGLTVDNSTLDL